MIVDAHLHLWDKVRGRVGNKRLVGLKNGLVRFGHRVVVGMPPLLTDGRNTAERCMALMDAAGVDGAVVVQEFMDGNQNAYLARVRRTYPDRFYCHALLEFRRPDGCWRQYRHAVDRLGLQGVKVPATYLAGMTPRVYLTDLRFMRIWADMEARGMVLSLDLASGDVQCAEVRQIARAFPKLKIAVGHFGMVTRSGWMNQIRLAEAHNVWIESGGITWLFRHEGPPFAGAQKAIRQAARAVGIDKLMWGSDYPRTTVEFTYRQTLDFVRDGCEFLSPKDKRLLLGGTARRVYGFKTPKKARQPIPRITED